MNGADGMGQCGGFEMDLGPLGAPGYTLRERFDFGGHPNRGGVVDPHINMDVLDTMNQPVHGPCRDLQHTQLPGMNGMQMP